MAPSHYLNQWWNIVTWNLRNKFQWNQNSNILIEENTFENVCEMLSISAKRNHSLTPLGRIYMFIQQLSLFGLLVAINFLDFAMIFGVNTISTKLLPRVFHACSVAGVEVECHSYFWMNLEWRLILLLYRFCIYLWLLLINYIKYYRVFVLLF